MVLKIFLTILTNAEVPDPLPGDDYVVDSRVFFPQKTELNHGTGIYYYISADGTTKIDDLRELVIKYHTQSFKMPGTITRLKVTTIEENEAIKIDSF